MWTLFQKTSPLFSDKNWSVMPVSKWEMPEDSLRFEKQGLYIAIYRHQISETRWGSLINFDLPRPAILLALRLPPGYRSSPDGALSMSRSVWLDGTCTCIPSTSSKPRFAPPRTSSILSRSTVIRDKITFDPGTIQVDEHNFPFVMFWL